MSSDEKIYFRYHIRHIDGRQVTFDIRLDSETLEYLPPENRKLPNWARLDYLSCNDCALRTKNYSYCPIAVNISDIIDSFGDVYSYDIVDVRVETMERDYIKEQVPVQRAVSSLLGIIMVSSGCEGLDVLRPMVRFHLPFASIQETIYRAASMYLIAQYFRKEEGLEPDWDMDGLVEAYNNITHINEDICRRLQIASKKDASLNAVVILDTFARMMPLSLEETLKDFEYLFSPYLKQ